MPWLRPFATFDGADDASPSGIGVGVGVGSGVGASAGGRWQKQRRASVAGGGGGSAEAPALLRNASLPGSASLLELHKLHTPDQQQQRQQRATMTMACTNTPPPTQPSSMQMRVDVGGRSDARGDSPLSPFAVPPTKKPISAPDRVPATSRVWLREPEGETEGEERAAVPPTPSTSDVLQGA